MEPMMTTTGWNLGLTTLWGLHILSIVGFFSGVIFLIVLAIKTFTPAQLKTWAIGLLIGGTILCLFTVAMIGRPWIGPGHYGSSGMNGMQMQMMNTMMERMMEHNQGTNGEEQMEHGDMMQMMRMMMGKGMMGASGTDDLTDSNSSSAIIDEHHESSSSSR
jgi:hypothetical protein